MMKSKEFENIIWGIMEKAGKPNVSDFFPILRPFDPQGVHAKMTSYMKKLCDIFYGIIEERICSRASKADEVCNDGLDSLLNNNNIGETTSKELCEAIGKDETIEESHTFKLPFLQAVVKETLRLHPPAPFLVPNKAMGRDPTVWANPNVFIPQRFLECDINYKGNNFELIPFGAVHLIVTSLLRNFEWTFVDGLKPEDMNIEEQFGLTLKRVQPLRVQTIIVVSPPFVWNKEVVDFNLDLGTRI
ncbi:cytochrome P450 family protein [Medicago truncatula]|uniref:Cytochrome P450 family protein n=1 Tax=Medicago truncatula TaxID=3880 RepID=G7L1C6_MEDTR|nr:cytochrome P450 family protein [Medicago truncatula]